jgi:hypothetical protein
MTKRSAKPVGIHIFAVERKLPSAAASSSARPARIRSVSLSRNADDLPDSSLGDFLLLRLAAESTSGTMVRLAWAPNVAPNDAERASSLTTSEVTLSVQGRRRPGHVDAQQSEAGAELHELRASASPSSRVDRASAALVVDEIWLSGRSDSVLR